MANTPVANPRLLRCDGCGQPASEEHITRRLQRLEWATRFRPVHIGTLLVGAIPPDSDSEFLYATPSGFSGEAGIILAATGLSANREIPETTLAEFQKRGFLLAHVLDCPLDGGVSELAAIPSLLAARIPGFLARIRRSLRPKRLVPISGLLAPMLNQFQEADLRCEILLDAGQPFALDGDAREDAIARVRQTLAARTVVIG